MNNDQRRLEVNHQPGSSRHGSSTFGSGNLQYQGQSSSSGQANQGQPGQSVPPGHPGQPATPRMLRSISGSLKSSRNDVNEMSSPTPTHSRNSSHHQPFDTNNLTPQTPMHRRVPSTNTPRQMNVPNMNPKVINQHMGASGMHGVPSPHPSQNQVGKIPPVQTNSQNNELLPPVAISTNLDNNSTMDSKISKKPSKNLKPNQSQQPFHRKSIGDWDFIKTIGAGSMGKVKLAQHNSTGEICAVKIVPRAAKSYQREHANDPPPQSDQEAHQRVKEFEKEVARDKRTVREGALGRLLFHPYICRLYEIVPMTNHYYMLFEYVEGGQMLDYIVAHGSLKEKHARKFARGIASALDYCHRNNVVHRDLKIENIMINQKGDIKIIDFGLSNLYSPKSLLKTYCGSLYFAAPELLSAKPYIGPEVDVWSFGVVLYVLVCGKVPFDDQSVSVLHEKIKKANVEYPSFLSKECVSLLSRMLHVDPTKRATLFEVMNHPWINKGFEFAISTHIPKRVPLTLPLDGEILKTISTFDLGNINTITEELNNIVGSVEYQMSSENWYRVIDSGRDYGSASNAHILPDPTGGFHPLVSIYYLVDEMKKRKKAKEELVKAQVEQVEKQQQEKEKQEKEKENMMVDPPTIQFPQQAYHQSDVPPKSMELSPSPVPPQQQPESPDTLDPNKVGSIFRRLSKKEESPKKDPMVRRGVSMKVTAKEKSDSRIDRSNIAPATVNNTNITVQPVKTPVKRSHNRSSSINTPNKHGFVPVEYLPPLPNIDTQTNQVIPNKSVPTRKLHPTARSKSLGGNSIKREKKPSLSHTMEQQNSDEKIDNDKVYDGYFDDIMLDDEEGEYSDLPPLSEEQIIEQFNNAKPNTMPSIEYPKTLFLKGFFSVQTTSTKPLPVIRYNIINVLTRLGVKFQEVKGGFVCAHTPSLQNEDDEEEKLYGDAFALNDKSEIEIISGYSGTPPNSSHSFGNTNGSLSPSATTSPVVPSRGPSRQPSLQLPTNRHRPSNSISSVTSNSSGHRRKFSIGGSILRRKEGSNHALMPPNTPAAARINKSLYGEEFDDDEKDYYDELKLYEDDSVDSMGNLMIGGGSDMLSSKIDHKSKSKIKKSPLKFEIHVVKFPLVGLYGVQFKKLLGNTWNYKTLASQILNELKL